MTTINCKYFYETFYNFTFTKNIFLHSIAQTNFTNAKYWNETDSTFHIVQDERIGWEISGNFGAYFANKYQAKFYDGRKENKNNIDYIFNNKY